MSKSSRSPVSKPPGRKARRYAFVSTASKPTPPVHANRRDAGSTSHFHFYADEKTGKLGLNLAERVRESSEQDYHRLQRWFGVEPFLWSDIEVNIRPGNQGAENDGNSVFGNNIWIDAFDGDDVALTRMLFVAELDEIFMDASDAWDPGDSDGEGLSRAMAFCAYPSLTPYMHIFETVPTWLDTLNHFGQRQNWVDRAKNTDRDYVSTGCATLFLNWLRYDLHFGWRQILTSGFFGYVPTLGARFQLLTGEKYAWSRFTERTQDLFPSIRGVAANPVPSVLLADNAFPSQLQIVGLSAGELIHSARDSLNTWTPAIALRSQTGNPGRLTGVSSAAVGGEAHITATMGTRVLHSSRNIVASKWSTFADITPPKSNKGVMAVASAGVANEVHLVTSFDSGVLAHTLRHANQRWEPFRRMAQFPTPVTSIAAAAVEGELHVAVVHKETVYHRIRHLDHWDGFTNIKTKTGDPGILRKVACTECRNELHLFAWPDTSEELFYTVRRADSGDWTHFIDITDSLGKPGPIKELGCAEVARELHVVMQTRTAKNYHASLGLDGIWSPFVEIMLPNTKLPGPFDEIAVVGV